MKTPPLGFSLVELMIAVVISGVLASIAIPTFKRFKYNAQFSESYNSLATLVSGAKAYYQAEHHRQGLLVAGSAGPVTHCTVVGAWTSNAPGVSKTVIDWTTEAPSFTAVSFSPPDPIYFRYFVGGAHSGQCGHVPKMEHVVVLVAIGDFDEDSNDWQGLQWSLCSNGDNELFTCSRYDSPSIEYPPH